jgi:hypothetical protein
MGEVSRIVVLEDGGAFMISLLVYLAKSLSANHFLLSLVSLSITLT